MTGAETLIPARAKPEVKGEWTLRLHEVAGQRGQFIVKTEDGWRVNGETAKKIHLKPYEIVSIFFKKS
jgi:hypothetical protein